MTSGPSMNVIEQAARRLEEMQRAGVQVPWKAVGGSAPVVEPGSAPAVVVAEPAQAPATSVVRPFPGERAAVEAEERVSREVRIDLQRLAEQGYLVPGALRSTLADEMRVIKRPLLKNAALDGAAVIRRGNLIQVTSALAGEGKTFTAINLALSLSMEVDHSVLLVDADVVRPAVFDRLGLQRDRGLMDKLRDPSIDLGSLILRTNVPKLSLLPSGEGGLNSTELLASATMDELLDEMANRYADRIIIFDAPPLLAATESRVLAARMGQVVVMVEAGRTPRVAISEAFNAVAHCPVVLPVLNKYTGPHVAGSYGY